MSCLQHKTLERSKNVNHLKCIFIGNILLLIKEMQHKTWYIKLLLSLYDALNWPPIQARMDKMHIFCLLRLHSVYTSIFMRSDIIFSFLKSNIQGYKNRSFGFTQQQLCSHFRYGNSAKERNWLITFFRSR